MKEQDEEWPEILLERELETDVELIEEDFREKGLRIKSKLEGTITADLQPGERLQLHWRELEIEMGEYGIASILVESELVWLGRLSAIEELHTYSSSIDKTLCGLAVNGKLVWVRQWKKPVRSSAISSSTKRHSVIGGAESWRG